MSRAALVLVGTAACGSGDPAPPNGPPFVVATFNTGTTSGLPHDAPPDDGYGSVEAGYSNDYYGDGLAWVAAIDDTRAFLAGVSPDVIAFQELFDPATGCAAVPPQALPGFVCATWQPGDPSVAQMIVGSGYQVACHPGHPDNCIAVKRSFGTFAGCSTDACPELIGGELAGCGHGARVARGVIELAGGGTLTAVDVHGTSGFAADDEACRVRQVDQVFLDIGDGAPGANGERNLVLGDLNTDPGRLLDADRSARRWTEFVTVPGSAPRPFHFVSAIGPEAQPTYSDTVNIDHVISDVATGTCWAGGVSDGRPAPTAMTYFDHHPVVCDVAMPE